MTGRHAAAPVAVAALIVSLLCACRAREEAVSRPAGESRRADGAMHRAMVASRQEFSLPDVSRMEPSVRRQMRDQYAAVEKAREDPQATNAERAAAYGRMGNLLFAAQLLDAAESCYSHAVALDSANRRWPYYLGHVYRTQGDAQAAAAAFEQALRLRPSDVATLVWLGKMYLDWNRTAEAEALFTRALAAEPRSAAALFGLGRTLLARGSDAKAAATLEQALEIDPRMTVAHYSLAMAYRALGDLDKAEAHLRQRGEVEVGPTDPLMDELRNVLESAVEYDNRGVRALESGRWQDAEAHFRKGLELAPDDASLHHHLGTALAMRGDPRGAFEAFQTAIRLSPGLARAHYSLGVLLASNPRGRQPAIAELEAAIRADPRYVEAHVQLAHLLRRDGRARDALAHYDQALTIDPREDGAHVGAAKALVSLQRSPEAVARLVEAGAAHPDRPALTLALARLLAAAPDDRARDGRRALALMQELARGPQTVETAEAMAMALAETGQYDEALRWQRDAVASAERAGRAEVAARMTDNLRLYQRREACRTPWREDE